MVDSTRVAILNHQPICDGRYVLYWMQASQRTDFNHALEYAIEKANTLGQPLVVGFGLTDCYPEANLRHYHFMLEGLQEVDTALRDRGIRFVVRLGAPDRVALDMAQEASLVVVDRGYQRIQKQWYNKVARKAPCQVIQVETDVVVPVEVVSDKEEYAAATIRRKIHKHLDDYLVPVATATLAKESIRMNFESLDMGNLDDILGRLRLNRKVPPAPCYRGGTSRAKEWLAAFISKKLPFYADRRNDPSLDYVSHMSPYLHFGQISPLYIALAVQQSLVKPQEAVESYLEELIVRRELSMNFVHYNPSYDSYEGLPNWAKETLRFHEKDERDAIYLLEEFEKAQTHDPYWNAAQKEMMITGKMHNYMRMYWGKKILEWSQNAEEGFKTAIYLNNKYELDGRDPNGYAGVSWCFGKHDRPWQERAVFGKVRCMVANGLRRKFNIEEYVEDMERLGNTECD